MSTTSNNSIKRLLIIGCPGSGKSLLAKKISPILQLPFFSLDDLYWEKNWVRSDLKSFLRRLNQVLLLERWIIDGNYMPTLSDRLRFADAVIFIDLSTYRCLYGALTREVKRFFGFNSTLPKEISNARFKDRTNFDFKFFRYIFLFRRNERPKIFQKLENFKGDLYVIKTASERKAAFGEIVKKLKNHGT